MPLNKRFSFFKMSHKQINFQRLIDLEIPSPLLFTNPPKNHSFAISSPKLNHLTCNFTYIKILVHIDFPY